MGRVIHRPPSEHRCLPGWKNEPLPADSTLRRMGWTHHSVMDDNFDAEPGTVWQCHCGRTWVARRNAPGHHWAWWVPESRLRRWWRERRQQHRTEEP